MYSFYILTLVLLNTDMSCLGKQCRYILSINNVDIVFLYFNPSPAEPGYVLPLQTV